MEAVISLARAPDMSTVAEGIETVGQAKLLQTLVCCLVQSYYFVEPQPAWEASAMLPDPPDRPAENAETMVCLGESSGTRR